MQGSYELSFVDRICEEKERSETSDVDQRLILQTGHPLNKGRRRPRSGHAVLGDRGIRRQSDSQFVLTRH